MYRSNRKVYLVRKFSISNSIRQYATLDMLYLSWADKSSKTSWIKAIIKTKGISRIDTCRTVVVKRRNQTANWILKKVVSSIKCQIDEIKHCGLKLQWLNSKQIK